MPTPAEFPPELMAYFEASARRREAEIDERLAELTPRERSLVRDAAVMGYVLGRIHPADEPHPKDTAALRAVVYAVLQEPEGCYRVLRGTADHYTEPEAAP